MGARADRQAPPPQAARVGSGDLVPPGNSAPTARIEAMLRVDHAGEHGAVAIYRGQRAVFDRLPSKRRIARQLETMQTEEQTHLDAFDRLLLERRVRPTALMPLWSAAGHALGVATALMGERAAHACTEAVESVIEQHYQSQVDALDRLDAEPGLRATFAKFREEEIAHKDLAIEEGAKSAAGYALLSGLIKLGCRVAIKISERA